MSRISQLPFDLHTVVRKLKTLETTRKRNMLRIQKNATVRRATSSPLAESSWYVFPRTSLYDFLINFSYLSHIFLTFFIFRVLFTPGVTLAYIVQSRSDDDVTCHTPVSGNYGGARPRRIVPQQNPVGSASSPRPRVPPVCNRRVIVPAAVPHTLRNGQKHPTPKPRRDKAAPDRTGVPGRGCANVHALRPPACPPQRRPDVIPVCETDVRNRPPWLVKFAAM